MDVRGSRGDGSVGDLRNGWLERAKTGSLAGLSGFVVMISQSTILRVQSRGSAVKDVIRRGVLSTKLRKRIAGLRDELGLGDFLNEEGLCDFIGYRFGLVVVVMCLVPSPIQTGGVVVPMDWADGDSGLGRCDLGVSRCKLWIVRNERLSRNCVCYSLGE